MLLIHCPWCGERAQIEFAYAGDASRPRPPDLERLDPEAWLEHVYQRPNPRGRHEEYWQHVAGCRRFLKVVRDTATHAILASEPPAPAGTRGRG